MVVENLDRYYYFVGVDESDVREQWHEDIEDAEEELRKLKIEDKKLVKEYGGKPLLMKIYQVKITSVEVEEPKELTNGQFPKEE